MLNTRRPHIFSIHKNKRNGDPTTTMNERNILGFNHLKRLPWIKEVYKNY